MLDIAASVPHSSTGLSLSTGTGIALGISGLFDARVVRKPSWDFRETFLLPLTPLP